MTFTASHPHPLPSVQVAALLCVANLIQSLNEASEREAFQPMVPAMLSALGRCLQGGEENSAQEVLEALIEVAENHPKFLRRHLAEVVSAMLQVGGEGGRGPVWIEGEVLGKEVREGTARGWGGSAMWRSLMRRSLGLCVCGGGGGEGGCNTA